ncbi:DUF317 domain-containing protein [Streptomyces acidiscabies]|uniref:DUF317 domain-containing protein n=1 Tax=Streptomyces acidiscabies TaxID=42234 RepID=A0AAP6BJD7_9ACTN|nr:DUF317 domain-containing protein [Streptomyces acidiscabies]MBP5935444.1 DUF317 domain-containing protein [Streptomyces sp. LBUM 1476]MBZ3916698.1 DUF317 domain-containing protein [Streptomyces acidiscabies]MDX2965665.1 DUF317 domain-containing protein [Streptomyces acidiscabies]MDX3024833.1 DUF317 domain-containing protein [Streptomyces acidiscabies]MDX3795581.1 DUF317 domain-containing protein [Streptomyces acidiscabies]
MPVTERQLEALRREYESTYVLPTGPRHLAGPGDPRHITHALLAAGWTLTSDPAHLEVELTGPDRHFGLRLDSTAWTLRTQHGGHRYASFSRSTPVEILAGLTDTLLTPAPADTEAAGVTGTWNFLQRAGWTVTPGEFLVLRQATSPDRRIAVGLVQPAEDVPDHRYWTIRALKSALPPDGSVYGGSAVWDGQLSKGTSADAMTGFLTALTSTEPLWRPWSQTNWTPNPPESDRQIGAVVATAHEQRVKHIAARVRAARRKPPAAVPHSPAPNSPSALAR